ADARLRGTRASASRSESGGRAGAPGSPGRAAPRPARAGRGSPPAPRAAARLGASLVLRLDLAEDALDLLQLAGHRAPRRDVRVPLDHRAHRAVLADVPAEQLPHRIDDVLGVRIDLDRAAILVTREVDLADAVVRDAAQELVGVPAVVVARHEHVVD